MWWEWQTVGEGWGSKNARALHAPGMSALKDFEEFIRDKIEKERWTHKQISAFLEETHPGQRGFSVRSVERFYSYKGIHKPHELTTTSWMRPYLML